ncbi:uncharacterized protein LOC114286872 [Camellia sinensis]|uniref:uncharacterized protein LOC114286872 n=1 Tax=Camellia sinensis TaxID=4442 RepID=UPI001035CDC7|nr:uncharacterized protein LOC114286872 [Camellia sinensis]
MRYWEEYNDLEENVCSEQMAVMSFKHGLRPESKLRQSLTKRPAIALKNLCARIEQKLSLSEQHLTPAVALLVGFNSQPEWPLGRIVLPVVAETKTLQIEFLVFNRPSPYNAILARPWIHQMEAVPSTYHQVIRFPTEHGVEQISRDQVASKHCFMAAMKAKQLCNRVQIVEVAEQLVLENVGETPEEKMVEDLEKVLVKEDDPEKHFFIGTSLGTDKKLQLLELLRENMEVFAWSAYDTLRLNPEFSCHKLNINPSARPVVQKSQRSSVEHTEAVIAEVEKLLASGAIREVQYPQWLSNIVIVKKKNGKWRVCVDFTCLNRACPKDSFPLPCIDQPVDSTASHEHMSFLDAYSGYH